MSKTHFFFFLVAIGLRIIFGNQRSATPGPPYGGATPKHAHQRIAYVVVVYIRVFTFIIIFCTLLLAFIVVYCTLVFSLVVVFCTLKLVFIVVFCVLVLIFACIFVFL